MADFAILLASIVALAAVAAGVIGLVVRTINSRIQIDCEIWFTAAAAVLICALGTLPLMLLYWLFRFIFKLGDFPPRL